MPYNPPDYSDRRKCAGLALFLHDRVLTCRNSLKGPNRRAPPTSRKQSAKNLVTNDMIKNTRPQWPTTFAGHEFSTVLARNLAAN